MKLYKLDKKTTQLEMI